MMQLNRLQEHDLKNRYKLENHGYSALNSRLRKLLKQLISASAEYLHHLFSMAAAIFSCANLNSDFFDIYNMHTTEFGK